MTTRHIVLGAMPPGANPDIYIAAGPWCFYNQENAFPDWHNRFIFAPEPFANPEKLAHGAKAAQALAISLIPTVKEILMRDYKVELPASYWNILLLPWLINLTSQLIDRSARVLAMIESWRNESIKLKLLAENINFNFANEQDFMLRGVLNIKFNHWLFSRIFENMVPQNWQVELDKDANDSENIQTQNSFNVRAALKNFLLSLPFPKIKGISLRQALQVSLDLNHPCHEHYNPVDIDNEYSCPELLENFLPKNFDTGLICKKTLPGSFLALEHKPITFAKRPKMKIASIVAQENTLYRQHLAYWVAKGNHLAHIQHGGNYGIVKTPCAASLTEYDQSIFFTWGWKEQGSAPGNFMPMPALQLSKLINKWQGSNKGNLVFVGTEIPVFARRLDSHPTPLQYVGYREAKSVFFQNLPAEILNEALYRPYFSLPGTLEDASWLKKRIPNLKICTGDLMPQLLNCKLLVVDHHGTTLLEAMTANIPLIAFWNTVYWPVTPHFNAMLKKLAKCGIFHFTPQSAAGKITEIWKNVSDWWNNCEIQNARKAFCESYAQTINNPIPAWRCKLKSL